MEFVEEVAAEGPSRLNKELDRRGPAALDTLEELKTWASFQPKAEPSARPPGGLAPLLPLEAVLPSPHFDAHDEPYAVKPEPIFARGPRIGRNDPCPCGSGKKFKKCCGAKV